MTLSDSDLLKICKDTEITVGSTELLRIAVPQLISQLAAANERIGTLRYALRQGIVAAGGAADADVSDEFLLLLPAEIGSIREKYRKLATEVTRLRMRHDDKPLVNI